MGANGSREKECGPLWLAGQRMPWGSPIQTGYCQSEYSLFAMPGGVHKITQAVINQLE